MKRATPLITVTKVEDCLPFWTALGFEITATVPHEGEIGFAMLHGGDVQLMYQSRASVHDDLGSSGAPATLAGELADSTAALFVEVDALDRVLDALSGVEIVVPRRETFYGMDEIFVRAPCGTLVGFAAKVASS